LRRHGTDEAELGRMAALHTDVSEVGGVAERAQVRELILSHYLPADPGAVTDWAQRAGRGFSGKTTAGHDGLRRSLPLCSVALSRCPAAYRRLTGALPAAGDAIATGTYPGFTVVQ
jgi:hypothetical protein